MYLRILHKERADTEAEAATLRAHLELRTVVTSITRHPRGGFAVQCDHREGLVEHLAAADYLAVI